MEYSQNRDSVLRFRCSEYELDELKNKYKNVIASTREYEKITNLDQLIVILERRNEVRPENMNIFKDIASTLGQTLNENVISNTTSNRRGELNVINSGQGSYGLKQSFNI